MTAIRPAFRARPTTFAALVAATALAAPDAHAQSEGRFQGDVSVRTGYSSNPFLTADSDTGSPYGEFVFSPNYTLTDAVSSTELGGNVRVTEYFERYDGTESYSARASHQRNFDEFTNADVSIVFDSSVLGEREILLGVPGEPDVPEPIDPNVPAGPDIPLIGTADRQSTLSVNGGVSHRFSQFDNITLRTGASRTWYKSNLADDYRAITASAAYTRTISERTTVGLYFGTDWTKYDAGTSNATIYTPRLTFSRRINSALSLEAELGAQFIERDNGGNSNGFSGNVSLCRTDPRSTLCLRAAQDAASSGIGGVRQQTSASLNYSYRLGEYDSVRASASYNRYGAAAGVDDGSEYVASDVSWERRLSERLLGGTNVSYRKVFGSGDTSSADFNFQVFVRYTLGQLR